MLDHDQDFLPWLWTQQTRSQGIYFALEWRHFGIDWHVLGSDWLLVFINSCKISAFFDFLVSISLNVLSQILGRYSDSLEVAFILMGWFREGAWSVCKTIVKWLNVKFIFVKYIILQCLNTGEISKSQCFATFHVPFFSWFHFLNEWDCIWTYGQ